MLRHSMNFSERFWDSRRSMCTESPLCIVHWAWREGMRGGGVSALLCSLRIHPRGANSGVVRSFSMARRICNDFHHLFFLWPDGTQSRLSCCLPKPFPFKGVHSCLDSGLEQLFLTLALCLFLKEDQSLYQRMVSEVLPLSLCPADQPSLLVYVLASFLEVEELWAFRDHGLEVPTAVCFSALLVPLSVSVLKPAVWETAAQR